MEQPTKQDKQLVFLAQTKEGVYDPQLTIKCYQKDDDGPVYIVEWLNGKHTTRYFYSRSATSAERMINNDITDAHKLDGVDYIVSKPFNKESVKE